MAATNSTAASDSTAAGNSAAGRVGAEQLFGLDAAGPDYASRFVAVLLRAARTACASDVHLQPVVTGLEIQWRRDGVLQPVGVFPAGEASDIVTRLKVLAGLLTYRVDAPQEGRIRNTGDAVEMRVSTFPTLHGERAVVRLFGQPDELNRLADLGLPDDLHIDFGELLHETSGAILIVGPAGSGKTTTAYACLRELAAASGGRSLVTLEDPIEMAVEGVAQAQVQSEGEFDLATGLRSLMRQDPEVILVGEMRDASTAATVLQASLTGHLVLSTFHAGSAAEAVSRLLDMGLEPYLLRSGILAILSQRLLRRLCDCARPNEGQEASLGLPVQQSHAAVGCDACLGSGYRGRLLLAELLPTRASAPGKALGKAVLAREDTAHLHRCAVEAGMRPLARRALDAISSGQTSPAEVRRVFGFSPELFTIEST